MVIMRVLGIEEVRVSRVHPPCVDVVVHESLEILPIDISGFRMERVIYPYTARVVHAWRPECAQTALRPCLEIIEKSFCLQILECLCHRTETCPDADHDMGIVPMYLINHPFSIDVCVSKEVHRIPCIVAAPVLPVLDDTVERDVVRSVPSYDFHKFVD